ncbi:MAG: hypothetical protein SWH68_01115, partial [Thermodesulfobacteriota bacterium]|nr:hypothetical protein [Thermodesulfobacteriota bacterium]
MDFKGTRFEIEIGIGIEIDKLRFDCEAMAHVLFCKNTRGGGWTLFTNKEPAPLPGPALVTLQEAQGGQSDFLNCIFARADAQLFGIVE